MNMESIFIIFYAYLKLLGFRISFYVLNVEEKNSFSKFFSGKWKITQKGKMVD